MNKPSYWFLEVPDEKRYPTFGGNLRVDAAVMGGGIAGISAAYFLSRAGIKTALLETSHLATGDSGYTTAFASHFIDTPKETAESWAASEAGIALFKEVIAKERISCEWQETGSAGFTPPFQKRAGFTREKDLYLFKQAYKEFLKADATLEYLEKDDASSLLGFPVEAAYYKKGGEGKLHIRKFLIALAERAAAYGCRIFEESEVTGIDQETPLKLRTSQGTLETEWLVVATGPPPRLLFPVAASTLRAAITYVIQVTFGKKKPFGDYLFWDDHDPYHYFRWVSDTELILGGEDRLLGTPALKIPAHAALASWIKELTALPDINLAHQWQGSIFYSKDRLPYIGAHPAYSPNILFLTGFGGNGMAHGILAGVIAAHMIQGKENQYQHQFLFDRHV